MKPIYLIVSETSTKTTGCLCIGDEVYNTIELKFMNNEVSKSSIKDDTYRLFCDYSYNKKRSVIELERKNGRSQIQIHYAIDAAWLEGCIGVESRPIEHQILTDILIGGYTHLIKKTIKK